MPDTVRYTELLPREFERRLEDAPIAYLPLGTVEWHGKHLPYGTDSLISAGFFVRLAERVGGVVAPPLSLGPDRAETVDGEEYYGMDVFAFRGERPQQLPGSAYWVPDDLFNDVIEATLTQLQRAGFEIVVAHGHGPSTTYFEEHLDDWEERLDLRLFTCRPDNDEPSLQVDHAAVNETSLMQALEPELVALDRLPPLGEEWPLGVDGEDPREHANADRGAAIINREIERMERLLEDAMAEV